MLYETYRGLMCHYYICLDLHPSRGTVISLKSWTVYLFPIVDRPIEDLQAPPMENKIAKAIIIEEDRDKYE